MLAGLMGSAGSGWRRTCSNVASTSIPRPAPPSETHSPPTPLPSSSCSSHCHSDHVSVLSSAVSRCGIADQEPDWHLRAAVAILSLYRPIGLGFVHTPQHPDPSEEWAILLHELHKRLLLGKLQAAAIGSGALRCRGRRAVLVYGWVHKCRQHKGPGRRQVPCPSRAPARPLGFAAPTLGC